MKVYVISSPQIDWSAWERFENDEDLPTRHWRGHAAMPEVLCELAARLCYMSYGTTRGTAKSFLDHIIQSGHHSVLEHANFTLFVTGISRSCSHEVVRHRHLSFSQLSQRYCDESKAEMIVPEVIEKIGDSDVFERVVKSARTAYEILVAHLEQAATLDGIEDRVLRRKFARQAARAVLPNAVETKMAITGNVRAWREFIQKRASKHADPEIRTLACEIHKLLYARAPLLFADLQVQVDECAST